MDTPEPLPESEPSFAAAAHRSLLDAGLVGEPVAVAFADRALHLRGAASGSLTIEAARTARVRFGYFQGKHYRLFVARIWPLGQEQPLIVEPVQRECPRYGAAMRQFAQAVAAARGIGHVERGLSMQAAVLLLVLLMLPVLGFTGAAIVLMGDDLRLGWYAILATSWLLAGVFLWLFFKRQRPRAVVSLDELEVQLPGPG